jgi:hypothetical protein
MVTINRSFRPLLVLYVSFLLLVLAARNVAANMAPIIDPADPGSSLALTILMNLPINLMAVAVLIPVSHLLKRNRVYEIEPHRFLPLVLLTVLILTIIGAIIDYYVISTWEVQSDTHILLYDPYLILTGLILIELSFFFAVLIGLKQTVLTSLIVGFSVVALNFTSWIIITHLTPFDLTCIGLGLIVLWSLFAGIALQLKKWYERAFHNHREEDELIEAPSVD